VSCVRACRHRLRRLVLGTLGGFPVYVLVPHQRLCHQVTVRRRQQADRQRSQGEFGTCERRAAAGRGLVPAATALATWHARHWRQDRRT
jgi:hypothetical protein